MGKGRGGGRGEGKIEERREERKEKREEKREERKEKREKKRGKGRGKRREEREEKKERRESYFIELGEFMPIYCSISSLVKAEENDGGTRKRDICPRDVFDSVFCLLLD